MLNPIDPSTTQSWQTLLSHFKDMKQVQVVATFLDMIRSSGQNRIPLGPL